MANETKKSFLANVIDRFGPLRKLEHSQSLFELSTSAVRFYIRYSKVHPGNRMFYGLRDEDLRKLEGYPSLLCFLWDGQEEPLLVPFSEYEEVFQGVSPAGDGQYKVQVFLQSEGTELYVAKAGRFNVEAHLGWGELERLTDQPRLQTPPDLSHSQVQTLLGGIGVIKGYDIWVPQSDRVKLDWSFTKSFVCREELPHTFQPVRTVLQEVDVIWLKKGSSEITSLFEVEHSTPIYSGLLRFNDIHLAASALRPAFYVVANEVRRSVFVRQLNRPTFKASGLSELCTFLDYINVFEWYDRIRKSSER